MALFNYATKEITLKIVYYGPGLSGKTTNLQYLHSILNPENKGRLLSLSTEADRTLFFDFLPVELGKIRDFSIRFQLYTVPGQVRYNATRKVVLKGADAVVFVADSQLDMREQNIESFENMRENLLSNNINPDEIPVVLQYNKRDLGNIASVEELNYDLNRSQYQVVESSAISGAGVEDSFRLVTRLLLKHISKKHQIEIQPPKEKAAEAPQPAGGKRESSVKEVAPVPPVAVSAPFASAPSPVEAVQALWPEEEPGRDVPPVEAALSVGSPHETKMEERVPTVEQASVSSAEIVSKQVTPVEKISPAEKAFRPFADVTLKKAEPEDKTILQTETVATVPSPESLAEKPVAQQLPGKPALSHETIDRIIEEMSSINGLLTDMKNSVYVLTKEMKEMKETKKEQEETNRILREISALFQQLQTKKSWFRF